MTHLEFFRVYAYCAGAIVVGLTLFALVMFGTWFLLEVVQPAYRGHALFVEFLLALAIIDWRMQPAQEWFRQRQALSRWRSRFAQALFVVIGAPTIFVSYYLVGYAMVRIAG
jgi:hypothetical protein